MTVDLRTCKAGDKLVSCNGMILTYVSPTPEGHYYDHFVRYPNGSEGTRIHDGHVMRNGNKRFIRPDDIVEIIPCASLAFFDEV